MSQPIAIIVAGPNGSGKTTFAVRTLVGQPFVNADVIASSLNPNDVDKVRTSAGKEVVRRISEFMEKKQNFAIETTLSGKRPIRLIRELKRAGYRVVLYYLWIPDPKFAIERVKARVQAGGHNIPAKDISRRFYSGMTNLAICATLVDNFIMLNNTGRVPTIMFRSEGRQDDGDSV